MRRAAVLLLLIGGWALDEGGDALPCGGVSDGTMSCTNAKAVASGRVVATVGEIGLAEDKFNTIKYLMRDPRRGNARIKQTQHLFDFLKRHDKSTIGTFPWLEGGVTLKDKCQMRFKVTVLKASYFPNYLKGDRFSGEVCKSVRSQWRKGGKAFKLLVGTTWDGGSSCHNSVMHASALLKVSYISDYHQATDWAHVDDTFGDSGAGRELMAAMSCRGCLGSYSKLIDYWVESAKVCGGADSEERTDLATLRESKQSGASKGKGKARWSKARKPLRNSKKPAKKSTTTTKGTETTKKDTKTAKKATAAAEKKSRDAGNAVVQAQMAARTSKARKPQQNSKKAAQKTTKTTKTTKITKATKTMQKDTKTAKKATAAAKKKSRDANNAVAQAQMAVSTAKAVSSKSSSARKPVTKTESCPKRTAAPPGWDRVRFAHPICVMDCKVEKGSTTCDLPCDQRHDLHCRANFVVAAGYVDAVCTGGILQRKLEHVKSHIKISGNYLNTVYNKCKRPDFDGNYGKHNGRCGKNAECRDGMYCRDWKCRKGAPGEVCVSDAQCRSKGLSWACRDHKCHSGGHNAKCGNNGQCKKSSKGARYCRDHKCREGRSGEVCGTDNDCRRGGHGMYACRDWACHSGNEGAKCGNNNQCRGDMSCKGWKCKKGQGHNGKCHHDSDCAGKMYCRDWKCRAGKQGEVCATDSQCRQAGNGMYGCQDWKCWSGHRNAKCGNDRQCRNGMKCRGWKCQ